MGDATSQVLAENDRLAGEGMRVLAVARRDFDPASFDPSADLLALVTDLQLLALVGIVDPPRKEAKDAIALCKDAGIRVRMITGDHATTAAAIAGQLGIEDKALTGAEFAALPDDQLRAQVDDIGVVARVAPEDKVRLVSILKGQGNIVAMTGDGVNDAPALTRADIGVAMGITGTEVTKDAAEMILTDDNFATIVTAVEGGRGLYDNLMKYVRVQMIMLAGFILLFVGAGIFTIANGTPLLPLQILWINFAIDVLLALGLGFDAPTPGLMKRRPRSPDEPVIAPVLGVRLGIAGLLIAIGTLAVVAWGEDRYGLGRRHHDGADHDLAAPHHRRPGVAGSAPERVQPGHDRQSTVQPARAGGAGAHVPGHDDRWPEPAARHRPARRPPVACLPRRRDRLLRPGRAGQARPPSDRAAAGPMILAEFGTGQVFWSLLWLSFFCIWIWMFIVIFGDLIRSPGLSGWAKALWTFFIIVLPFLGCFVYLIARGSDDQRPRGGSRSGRRSTDLARTPTTRRDHPSRCSDGSVVRAFPGRRVAPGRRRRRGASSSSASSGCSVTPWWPSCRTSFAGSTPCRLGSSTSWSSGHGSSEWSFSAASSGGRSEGDGGGCSPRSPPPGWWPPRSSPCSTD